jgi:N-acyl-D-amino-acid deacylase
MTEFLRKNPAIPGAALAVGRNGKVVYARGFGYADLDRSQPVQPDALFRIASVSKPLTAVAVLQLVERGQLRLDAKVFDVLGLRRPTENGVQFDERWRTVTIQQLLHHTGGWDRDESFDPMFMSPPICKELAVAPPAVPRDIIRYMLRRPLDFEPGTRDAYSNLGYCLLGRVIEKVSSKSYEEFVRQEVLGPLGARDARVGRTLVKDRFPREVWYDAGGRTGRAALGPDLGKRVPLPYGVWCLEAMDSHGGWVASAADLVHFGMAFDQPRQCKLLTAQSIELMFAPPPGPAGHDENGKVKEVYYGSGWAVRPYGEGRRNTFHFGLLDGCSSLLVRRADGLTWAALFNYARVGAARGEPAGMIDARIHQAADAVKEWP